MHYNPNSPVWQFVSLCLRYFILNLFFLISIIPIVTIGPARAALYSTVFAFSDNDDINLGREYIRRFKREFKRGLGILAIDVAAGAIFAFTPYLRFLFILLGFAWLAYAKSLLYLRAFQRVSGDPNTPREKPDYSLPSASIQ